MTPELAHEDMVIPLIFTTKGNLPMESLEYSTSWENTDDYIKLTETYRLEGEVVRQSAHVYVKKGMFFEPSTAAFT